MEKYTKSWDFHGRTITVENGEMAKQAGGSVLIRYNDTVVLSCATASKIAKDTDFFPLTVKKKEKMILWCLKENYPSRAFYESMGGKASKIKSKKFGEKEYELISYLYEL